MNTATARAGRPNAAAARPPAPREGCLHALPAAAGLALVAALALSALQGCVPALVVAGVGAGAMVVNDRRSTGAQVDDESIELKINTAAGSSYGNEIHLNVTSYNATVLLTGEVPSKAVLDDIVKVAKGTDRVKKVDSYLVIGPNAEMSTRTNDSYITSKVKARFVESDKFSATHVKVVTERGVVYLMGIVSRAEGDAAAQVAATTSGVGKVVKIFEYTT
jgi:osmotically-inducible protein OsmY